MNYYNNNNYNKAVKIMTLIMRGYKVQMVIIMNKNMMVKNRK